MVHLTVIILSFNTKEITRQCLDSLVKSISETPRINFEIIVIDNASSDGSPEMLHQYPNEHGIHNITWKVINNIENKGFVRGNNQGIAISHGNYVLFLNSDVIVNNVNFEEVIKYLELHEQIGALTIQVNLTQDGIDPASHRGFPTIWNSFCYFSKLEKVLGKLPLLGKVFGGYHLTYLNLNTIHEIDSPTGAFFLTRKDILNKIGGFDEEFFMYGEDLDLAYRIKQSGYQIIYYPLFTVTHLKRSSGLKKKDIGIRSKTRIYFYDAMKIFFRKHYSHNYPALINSFIYWSIDLKRKLE